MLLQVVCIRRRRDEPHIRVNAAPITMSRPRATLRFLVGEHGLSPSDRVFFRSNTHTVLLVTCIIYIF